jgi:hypothetical protein
VADIRGTYELGPGDGRVLVKTGREGLAARAGHDLTMEITQWSARVTVPGTGDLAAVLAVREGSGGAKPLSDRDRRDIKAQARKILGDPAQAAFASQKVVPSADAASNGAIEGTLTMHGTTQPLRLQVTNLTAGRFRGAATVRQTAFGITPYSGFFGTLKLKDEVAIEFEVTINDFAAGGM